MRAVRDGGLGIVVTIPAILYVKLEVQRMTNLSAVASKVVAVRSLCWQSLNWLWSKDFLRLDPALLLNRAENFYKFWLRICIA
jgi:hypothetical protein